MKASGWNVREQQDELSFEHPLSAGAVIIGGATAEEYLASLDDDAPICREIRQVAAAPMSDVQGYSVAVALRRAFRQSVGSGSSKTVLSRLPETIANLLYDEGVLGDEARDWLAMA